MTRKSGTRRLYRWSHLGGLLCCIGVYNGIGEEHTFTLNCYDSHYISTMP